MVVLLPPSNYATAFHDGNLCDKCPKLAERLKKKEVYEKLWTLFHMSTVFIRLWAYEKQREVFIGVEIEE